MRSLLGGLHRPDVTSSWPALVGDGERLVSTDGVVRRSVAGLRGVDEERFSRRTRTGGRDLSGDDSIVS